MSNNNYEAQAGIYQEAAIRAGAVGWLVAAGWAVFPFALQTVFHPSDAIWLQYVVQGQRVPRVFTARQEMVGLIEAVSALAVLVMFQLVGTVLFYRRVKMDGASVATPALWPLAALLAGGGNAAFFLGTGHFDVGGCLVGFSSCALTVGAEMLCEKLGREFVCGVPAQPAHSPQWFLGSPAQSGQAPLLYSESGQGPVQYHIPD